VKYKIPFIKPSFPTGAEIGSDYDKIVASNWFTNFGPYEQKFRREVAHFLNQDVNVSTAANATLAIDLAVRALLTRTETRNQVLVPSFTFAAGPEMLISNDYTPVFIDIEQESLQPNIDQAEKYIIANKKKMSGILLCNIFGVGNKNISEWEQLAEKYNLPLIIDSAAGFGSKYNKDLYIGSRGDCEIFSLHATKPFAVGEGGLVVSRNAGLIDKIRSLQNFGFDESRNVSIIGTNAKLQELNCAIGLRQLQGFKYRLRHRQQSLAYYKQKLERFGYSFQVNDDLSTVAFISVLAPDIKTAQISYTQLQSNGVEVKKYYAPLHRQHIIANQSIINNTLAVTEDVANRILSLPLHDGMSHEIIDTIVSYMKTK